MKRVIERRNVLNREKNPKIVRVLHVIKSDMNLATAQTRAHGQSRL